MYCKVNPEKWENPESIELDRIGQQILLVDIGL
jgi:hypothetical protein